ncbi:MAG: hypothetical protein M3Z21_03010 [Pseudomonadota bacterium]|nr:hypothetical protein [Pseudomonadota bacterium]
MAPGTILQIVPAEGWQARIGDEARPLACWALIEGEHGTRRVVGLVPGEGGLVPTDSLADFTGYDHGRGG